jgi:hypothetical protein
MRIRLPPNKASRRARGRNKIPRIRNVSARSRKLSLWRRRQKTTRGNYVAWVLRSVQLAGAAIIELSAALAETKPEISLRCAFRPPRHGRRPATHTAHPRTPPTDDTLTALSDTGQSSVARALTETVG